MENVPTYLYLFSQIAMHIYDDKVSDFTTFGLKYVIMNCKNNTVFIVSLIELDWMYLLTVG